MSLLLSTRQPGGGSGTILCVTIALGIPTAALQPAWLGADDFAPPLAVTIVDDNGYLPTVPVVGGSSTAQPWQSQQDEILPTLDDDAFIPMVVQPSQRVVYLNWDSSEVTVVATEDDAYLPLVQQPLPPQLRLFVSDPGPSVGLTPCFDEGEWRAPPPWTFGLPPSVWLATDDLPITPATVVEDDGYQPPSPQPAPTARLVWNADDETPAPLRVEDNEWLAPTPWATSMPRLPVLVHEDWVAPAVVSVVEDDGYLPVIQQPLFRLSLVVGGPAPAVAVPTGPPDEYHHWAQLLPRPETTVLFGPWSYSAAEDIGFVPVDDDLWLPIHTAAAWKARWLPPTLYDGDAMVQPVVATEEHWQAPVPWPLAFNRLVLVEPDEVPTTAAPLGVDEDSFIVSPTLPPFTVLFGPWSYAVSEDTGFLAPDDDLWLPRVVWPTAKPSLVWLDDEIICRPIALDEGQWIAPPLPPRAWARVVIEQPDEWPTPPPPLQVEDDCWVTGLTQLQLVQLVMPPALPPWFMEQHEQAADLKKPKKPRDGQIRLHVSRDGNVSVWYT